MNGGASGERLGDSPYLRSLGLWIDRAGDDGAVVRLPFRDDNANAGGVLHGGVVASVLDTAGVLAASGDVASETLDLTVDYLAPAIGEEVVGEARVRRRGREIVHTVVDVRTVGGMLVATGRLTRRVASRVVPAWESAPARPATLPSEPPALAGLLASSPFIRRLGVRVTDAGDGSGCLALPATTEIADATGAVHEGALAALLDTAGATAAWSLVPLDPRCRASTVGLFVSLHGPARGDVTAEACVIHRRGAIFANRVTLAAGGRIVATGAVTYRIVTPEP